MMTPLKISLALNGNSLLIRYELYKGRLYERIITLESYDEKCEITSEIKDQMISNSIRQDPSKDDIKRKGSNKKPIEIIDSPVLNIVSQDLKENEQTPSVIGETMITGVKESKQKET